MNNFRISTITVPLEHNISFLSCRLSCVIIVELLRHRKMIIFVRRLCNVVYISFWNLKCYIPLNSILISYIFNEFPKPCRKSINHNIQKVSLFYCHKNLQLFLYEFKKCSNLWEFGLFILYALLSVGIEFFVDYEILYYDFCCSNNTLIYHAI